MGEQPMPKSPVYVDLYGKRRQQANLQVLESEINFLQEELKSLEGAQPTSRCCKELNEFLATKPDPFITINQKASESDCSWTIISGCCESENARNQQAEEARRCCCSRKSSCCGCCGSKDCSCFKQKCCCFKSGRSSNCCKVKLCKFCAMSSCGLCCL
ncbi:hypothetical protein RND81_04G140400 [Saponaria officinalis]|uniref:G protein gamma domain-containing protein n=1 Tax=Saponaria officinalis TaxID=3572 RepID=A0AAW1LED5_SAPOF